MRAFKVYYPAGDRDPVFTVHDGHDWIYVLTGRLRLVLGNDDFVLEPGEAAEFSCRTPHWLGAVDGPAEALAIFGPKASGSTRGETAGCDLQRYVGVLDSGPLR